MDRGLQQALELIMKRLNAIDERLETVDRSILYCENATKDIYSAVTALSIFARYEETLR